MVISIGNDHAGTEYKFGIVSFLREKQTYTKYQIDINDYGTDKITSVDYPDFAHPVAKDVNREIADMGILICGSGNGVSMTANKYKYVRAALCWSAEVARLARHHNDANILTIPARFVSYQQALDMVTIFLEENFEGGRHCHRIDKINKNINVMDYDDL